MNTDYKNKMVNKQEDKKKEPIALVPVYKGPDRYFKDIGLVTEGTQLPDFPIKEAQARPDFILIKKEK